MLRAHARTDSRLFTRNYAEALPQRESHAAARAPRAHAHAPQIHFVLPERAAVCRALFHFVPPGGMDARPRVASGPRRVRSQTVAV
jgi:hypothetical protein